MAPLRTLETDFLISTEHDATPTMNERTISCCWWSNRSCHNCPLHRLTSEPTKHGIWVTNEAWAAMETRPKLQRQLHSLSHHIVPSEAKFGMPTKSAHVLMLAESTCFPTTTSRVPGFNEHEQCGLPSLSHEPVRWGRLVSDSRLEDETLHISHMRPTVFLNKVIHLCKSSAESWAKNGPCPWPNLPEKKKWVLRLPKNPSCERRWWGFLPWAQWGGWVTHTVGSSQVVEVRRLLLQNWQWQKSGNGPGHFKSARQFPHTWNLCGCSDVWGSIQADGTLTRDHPSVIP